jgi:glucosamine kinase
MPEDVLLLGVDGGGTRCRARLTDLDGVVLGEGTAGPANIRLGPEESLRAVGEAAGHCLRRAGLVSGERRIVACLALAGASEPADLARARALPHPFYTAAFTTDARAACIGAHGGRNGGIIIVGTGSVGWAVAGKREHRVGGWGFPISDEGSGAWLGLQVVRRVLWARDGRIEWTALLKAIFERFDCDPHAIVAWSDRARPRDYGSLAPTVVEHAVEGDPIAHELMRQAARHVDAMAGRLIALGVDKLSLMGGLAACMQPFLSEATRETLVPPLGDALSGALHMARNEAQRLALAHAD